MPRGSLVYLSDDWPQSTAPDTGKPLTDECI